MLQSDTNLYQNIVKLGQELSPRQAISGTNYLLFMSKDSLLDFIV